MDRPGAPSNHDHYSSFHLYVVSAFRRTTHGPAKAGHYVLMENALFLYVAAAVLALSTTPDATTPTFFRIDVD